MVVSLKSLCKRFSSGDRIEAYKIKKFGKYPVFGGNGIRGYTNIYNFDGRCAVIGRQGANCGNVKYFCGKAFMTEHAVVVEANEYNDIGYLSYRMSLMDLGKFQSQSAQPGLSVKTISEIPIEVPNLNIQKKIWKILNNISEKTNNNNHINNNLEELAYMIFLKKFTQKIPNGAIGEIIKENEKSKIKVSDAKTVKGKYPFFTSGESILEWNDYLVEGRNLFFNTGGNADVKYYVGKAMYSTDTWCVTTNGDFSDYLYLYFKSIRGELDRKFFHGSGLKHLQKDLLKQEKIYIPEKEEISQFNILVKPMFDTISANKIESQRLNSLKEFILPLLMNGQINVDDIEI